MEFVGSRQARDRTLDASSPFLDRIRNERISACLGGVAEAARSAATSCRYAPHRDSSTVAVHLRTASTGGTARVGVALECRKAGPCIARRTCKAKAVIRGSLRDLD